MFTGIIYIFPGSELESRVGNVPENITSYDMSTEIVLIIAWNQPGTPSKQNCLSIILSKKSQPRESKLRYHLPETMIVGPTISIMPGKKYDMCSLYSCNGVYAKKRCASCKKARYCSKNARNWTGNITKIYARNQQGKIKENNKEKNCDHKKK